MLMHTMPIQYNSFKIYKRLLGYIRLYWKWASIAVVSLLCLSLSESLFAWGIKPAVDALTSDHPAALVYYLPFIFFGLVVLRSGFSFLSEITIAYLAQNIIQHIRNIVYKKLLYLPKKYHDEHPTSSSISLMIYNVTQVSAAVSTAVLQFLQSLTLMIGLFVAMLLIHWQLTLISSLFILPTYIIVTRFSKRMRRITKQTQKSMATTTQILNDSLSALPIIKLTHTYNYAHEKFSEKIRLLCHYEVKSVRIASLCSTITHLVISLPVSLLLWIAVNHTLIGLSAGTFAALLLASIRIQRPAKQLTAINAQIQRGIAAAESIFDLIDLPVEADVEEALSPAPALKGELVFDQVMFRYQSDLPFVLKDISFTLSAGQSLAIVGQSGSGKSTLMHLLARFYPLTAGHVYLDGRLITDYQLGYLRRQIAFVTQNFYLFNASVAENITFNQPFTQAEIQKAAIAADAHDFISNLPEGYNTLIGEGGGLLSGGQKQRVTLARAFLQKSPILVLDEATSALDNITDRRIMRYLCKLKNKTIIIIAHRLSNIQDADHILVMDKGQIVAQGSHETLLMNCPQYQKLYEEEHAEQIC